MFFVVYHCAKRLLITILATENRLDVQIAHWYCCYVLSICQLTVARIFIYYVTCQGDSELMFTN